MPSLRQRFQPGLGFTVFAVLGIGLLWSLCAWQLGRREEARVERELFEQRLALPAFDALYPPDDAPYRRVHATGTPDWDHVQHVLGRYMWSQPGMQLILPVRLVTSAEQPAAWLFIDLGWVPTDEAEQIVERERGAGELRSYSGIARPFADDPSARIGAARWRSVSPSAMAAEVGVAVPPWVLVDGEGLEDDAPITDRVPPISGWRSAPTQRPHGEYAFTWFSLGLTLAAVWLSLSFSRNSGARDDAPDRLSSAS